MAFSFKEISLKFMIMTIFIFFVTSTIITTKASNTSRPFQNIYAFGDSYTDTGNTNSSTAPAFFTHVSNPPYGQTFFHRPTNRFSDGRLIIDFVAQALSLPFVPPYRNSNSASASASIADKSSGVNFAVAGCTAIDHEFFVKNKLILNKTPESLTTQLGWFNKVLESKGCKKGPLAATSSECRTIFDNALFWIGEIGINDYIYALPSFVSPKTIQDLAIATEISFLKDLLSRGAKYVVVQGLPPIGCLPIALYLIPGDRDKLGCVGRLNTQSYNHNAMLRNQLIQFQKQFPESVIVYADYWNSYVTVLRHSSSSSNDNNNTRGGIKEGFETCCGFRGGPYNFDILNTCGSTFSKSYPNPSKFINWDGIHLTEAMHEVLANSYINGPFSYPPFKDLVKMKLRSR